MPRRPRIHLANLPLHIVQRGHNRDACCLSHVVHKELERHAAGRKRVCPPRQKYLGQGAARVPREVRNLTDGRQEGEAVTGRKPGKHLVPINQRPSNGGCWRVNSRSLTEKTHVGVKAVGENHRKATHQSRQSIGGSVAHGVAIRLSVASRGEISGSTIVFTSFMHNEFNQTAQKWGGWLTR